MNKIILGGGISGLICGVLDPTALIITDFIGGIARAKNIAPFMIHFSWKTVQFLNAIGCPYATKICKVGYYYDGKIHDDLPAELAREYYAKSRGFTPEPTEYEAKRKYEGDFLYLAVSLEQFVDSMIAIVEGSRKRIRLGHIEGISLDRNEIRTNNGKYRFYGELISTLPAHIFFSLINRRDIGFVTKGKIFELKKESVYDIRNYNYVYFPEMGIPDMLLRITRKTDGEYVHEYPYISARDEIRKDVGIMPYAYIIAPKEVPKVKGIKFVGRYAEWNDKILIHDVIERLLK